MSPTPLKNMGSSVGMDGNSQVNWKIKFMFQTTNQSMILILWSEFFDDYLLDALLPVACWAAELNSGLHPWRSTQECGKPTDKSTILGCFIPSIYRDFGDGFSLGLPQNHYYDLNSYCNKSISGMNHHNHHQDSPLIRHLTIPSIPIGYSNPPKMENSD